MARKETDRQKETVERVMHEFKHGELKSGSGRKVKSPRQAIAIGLSEAGASDQQSPKENHRRAAETRSKEREGRTAMAKSVGDTSKAELYEEARKKNIPGRSKMDKQALQRALDE